MGGQDVKRREYIRKRWFSKKKRKKKEKDQKIENEQKEHWEKRVNRVFFYITLASSVRLGLRHLHHIFFNIKHFFLIFILRQDPLLLFDSLSYKFIDLDYNQTVQTHCSKWAWTARFFGPHNDLIKSSSFINI